MLPAKRISLKRDNVLRRKSDFSLVHREATVHIGTYTVVKVLSKMKETKIGIIASKRYSNKAVTRNRAKRLVREAFRLVRSNITSPKWIIVIVRGNMKGAKLELLQQELLTFLQKEDESFHS